MSLFLALLLLLLQGGDGPLVVTHASVVPMVDGTETVLADHAVIVEDGRVRWVGPSADCAAPEGARVVDARGGYLVPGLTDAHVHLQHDDELLLNVANGVTTVLNLSGNEGHLELRQRVEAGEILGPTILTAGPTIDGDPPRNPIFQPIRDPERAGELVLAQKEAGYDFLKVYDLISMDCYFAVVEAAQACEMTIVGHIPKAIGLEPTLEGHRMIAHAEEFFYTFFDNQADEARIPEAARLVGQAGVAVCPNIGFIHAILDQAHDIEAVLARPEVRYVHPDALGDWLPENNRYVGRPAQWVERNERMYPFLVKLTRALHDSGVVLLSGTDASIPGGVPGFALHAELDELVSAGLTPLQALRTVTVNPGRWTHENLDTPLFGQLAPGHRADLVLVDANPLEDLRALRTLRAVVVRGRFLEGDELRTRLEELARGYER